MQQTNSNSRPTETRRRGFRNLAVVLGVSLLAIGCASLIGIEDRKNETEVEDGLIEDEETMIRTRPQCQEYCDEVMDNCTGGDSVYSSRASCINTCNALPEGEAAEPIGNNVECRMRAAKAAASAPGEECTSAGPGGDPACGDNCEAWCQLLEAECPSDYEIMVDCEATCESIPDEGGFDVENSYSADDIQCRLIHLGAVGGDPDSVHCGHARYIAEEPCVPADDVTPDCDSYCDIAMANCRGSQAVYESRGDCEAACSAFPEGTLDDRSENTVGCRIYHGKSAAFGPSVHCNHAAPTGDGHCGSYDVDDDNKTGNCESYCMIYDAGCAVEFAADFASIDECAAACAADFADAGAEDDSLYSVETARDEDGLQCHTFYAVKAAAGDATACEKADPKNSCN